MNARLAWRPMVEEDLKRVVDMATVCYPDHYEDMAVYKERRRLFPAGSLILAAPGEPAQGYILSHPWLPDSTPPLNSLLLSLPADASTYYLHDLALMPAARGRGFARLGLEALLAGPAADYAQVALVSVNGTVPFWEGLGFVMRRTPELTAKVASYGPDARYMLCPLDARRDP